jgi:hypothetical protein
MNLRKSIFFAVFILMVSAPCSLAQGTYTQIDVPGAVQTFCAGINQVGDISGQYADASSVRHGFLLSGGIYTTIDYPGAHDYTALYGINDMSQAVGTAVTARGQIGFLYKRANENIY